MSTVNLNNADAIYFGDRPVDRVYWGTQRVWPPLTLTERVRALFDSADQGGMWDFTNPAGLYQDAAATLPVTGVGQPIGRADDLSGNGNHLSQATTPARPTYTVDGALHDGVDDFLVAANAADWTFLHDGTGGTLGISGSWEGDTGSTGYVGTQTTGTSVGVVTGLQSTSLQRAFFRVADGTTSANGSSVTGSWPAGQISSAIMSYSDPEIARWFDGVREEDIDAGMITPISEPPAQALTSMVLPSNGAIHCRRRIIVISRTLTNDELALVRSWLMEGVE